MTRRPTYTVVGIDLCTSVVKAGIYTLDGEVLGSGSCPVALHHGPDGRVEHDLDEFYAACLRDEAGQRKKSKLSPTTVHHRHVALKMELRRAVELGTLVRNPADFTSPPRPDRPQMRVLNETEVGSLLKALEGTPA